MKWTGQPGYRMAAAILMILIISSISLPVFADDGPEPADPYAIEVDPSIQAVWDMTDGQIVNGSVSRTWMFGPQPIATGIEYYADSPTGLRDVAYYDKGRLDLLNTDLPPGSIWQVSGALLVSEMLSGQIQLGEDVFAARDVPEIPIVGDLEQPNPVTYAALAPHSAVWEANPARGLEVLTNQMVDGRLEKLDDGLNTGIDYRRDLSQVGRPVTSLLTADGEVVKDAVADQGVSIVEFDELMKHNIASPFANWARDLPAPALNLLGLPVSEPYWVEAQIDGKPVTVLVQAFERRILTYTPTNPEGWKVESANVGLHYRMWRGLQQPERPELAKMATTIPFGEEIMTAARDNYIDPYMLTAVAANVSDGDPAAQFANNGTGLLGVRPDRDIQAVDGAEPPDLADPSVNAQLGAQQFATYMFAAWDWRTILGNYYGAGNPDWNDPALSAWVDGTLATYDELLGEYPPSGPIVDPVRESGKVIGSGRVAHYDPSYTVDWWEQTVVKHVSWGNAVADWQFDPNGFYCVHPDYLIGEIMKVEANGRVIECTIGDQVAIPHRVNWRAKWVLEMSWPAFKALGLDMHNQATVSYLGEREIVPPPPGSEPTATPEPTQTIPAPESQPPPPPTASPQPSTTPVPPATGTPVPPSTAPAPTTTVPAPTATAPATTTILPPTATGEPQPTTAPEPSATTAETPAPVVSSTPEPSPQQTIPSPIATAPTPAP